ncbi:MAG TPA: AAA family ATPase [Acidimicrobiales bacterium]|nr:AAA family ATPase [Acidimicrobiales bacterium]
MEALDGPVTVLFTDFEGSTDLHTRVGDEEARKLLDGYEHVIRGEVETHGGRAVKSLGDGLLVEFSSARRAVSCAVAVQRAVADHAARQPPPHVRVRVGINTGEVIHQAGDVFGSAVNAAARIMAEADGGQVLVSDVTRQLAEQGGGLMFREWGRVGLRGLPGEWLLHEAVWNDEPAATGPVRGPSDLVGRDAAQAVVTPAAEAAMRGRGQVVLIAGEAGIGKTALAEDMVDHCRRRGALVCWGTCWDGEGAPAYWPWVQVLRALLDDPEAATVLRQLGPTTTDLAILLPELAGDHAPPSASDADEARFRVFDAVSTLLSRASASRPLTVVLDDLHWADAPSLHLLAFLCRQLRGARVLIVGTYRDVESAANETTGPLLNDLSRSSVSVLLSGLAADDVASLITVLSGTTPDPDLAASIHRRTGGNPFFVREVTRLMASGSVAAGAIPEGVREVVERRLARLPQPCADMLAVAAVVGQDVPLDVLAEATGSSVTELLDLLDEAVRARMLADAPGPLGPYRFAHDLFRETLYNGLTRSARAAAHERVALALEQVGTPMAAEISRHWVLALPGGDPDRAVTWSTRAAEQAMGQLAFEDAANHYDRALQACDVHRGADDTTRLALQLGLAEALAKAGEGERARAVLNAVADLARRAGAHAELAAAALGLDKLGTRTGIANPHGEALLEEALAGTSSDDPRLRSLLLGALARHRYHTRMEQGAGDAAQLAEEAVAEARRAGDPDVLAAALGAVHDARWLPGQAAVRLEVTTEMEAAAEAAGDPDLLMQAALLRFTALLELGSADAPRQFERFARAARACRHRRASYYLLTREATVATMRGEEEEARRLLDASLALGEEIGEPDAHRVYQAQSGGLHELGGYRRSGVDKLDEADLTAFPVSTTVAVALELLDKGEVTRVRAMVAPFADGGLERLQLDYSWLDTVVYLAEAFRGVGFDDAARRAYEMLEPFRGSCVVTAAAVLFDGSVDHHLALQDAHAGNIERATAGFEAAIEIHERVGALWWAERSRDALEQLRAQHRGPRGVFRQGGDVWTLSFDDVTVHLKDAKGLRDLAVLLASPGVDVHATELLGSADRGGADAVLDDTARDAYRRRLSELEADVAEAEADHDDERAARAKAERDTVVDELSAAFGLGGRARTLGDPAERARKAVTARVRDAVTKITDQHPSLGAHLTASIATGTFCCYRPRQPVTWEL